MKGKMRFLYLIEKWKYDRKEKHYKYVRDENGYLYANGIYPTRIKPEELPEWYVYGRYLKCFGYLSAKGVKYMIYTPNMVFNHMFKDDTLYISYDQQIMPADSGSFERYKGYDIAIGGGYIVSFLKAAEQYSEYDISGFKVQIEEKRLWFKQAFPEDYQHEVSADKPYFE